ncbi:hypothetical protein MJD09_15495, partial [bacterium]|nr:hypothetical protein [bacterium]
MPFAFRLGGPRELSRGWRPNINSGSIQITLLFLQGVRIVLLLCLTAANTLDLLHANPIQSTGRTSFQFDLDTAVFRYDEERVYVEVYYGVASDQLQVTEKAGERVLSFEVELEVQRQDSMQLSRS